jgi:hypothetical protein
MQKKVLKGFAFGVMYFGALKDQISDILIMTVYFVIRN